VRAHRVIYVATVLVLALALASGAGASTKIRYAHWGGNPWIEVGVKAFNEAQSKVEVEFVGLGSFFDNMTVQLAAGTAPEAFSTGSFWDYGFFEFGQAGALLDLTPYVMRDKNELMLSDVPAPFQQMSQINGRWYGFPFIVYTGDAIWYNRDLFRAAGLNDPVDDWALDDFTAIAKKLTLDTDGDGIPEQWGAQGIESGFARMKNALFYNEEGTQFLSRSPEVRKGLQFMYDIYQAFRVAPFPALGSMPNRLDTGKVGMARARSNYSHYIQLAEGKWEFGIQFSPWDRDSGTRGVQIADDANFISINAGISTEKAEAAWEFLKFFVTEPGQKAAYEANGWLQIPPPHVRLMYKYYTKPQRDWAGMELHKFVENVEYLKARYDRPKYRGREVNSAFNSGITKTANGQMGVEQFLDSVGQQINALLAQGN
jgi:ABC-type glycerol-3-phosphate transport system substrate-binding protein